MNHKFLVDFLYLTTHTYWLYYYKLDEAVTGWILLIGTIYVHTSKSNIYSKPNMGQLLGNGRLISIITVYELVEMQTYEEQKIVTIKPKILSLKLIALELNVVWCFIT